MTLQLPFVTLRHRTMMMTRGWTPAFIVALLPGGGGGGGGGG